MSVIYDETEPRPPLAGHVEDVDVDIDNNNNNLISVPLGLQVPMLAVV